MNPAISKLGEKDVLSNKILTPNEILSSFFSKKGNSPLNTIEIEGVISLMSKNTTSNIDFSSFITPLKAQQQSLFSFHNSTFSPTCDSTIKFGSSLPTFSHSKKYSTFGPTISTPFRKRKSTRRSSFYVNNRSKQLSSKYDLLATIGTNENESTKSGDKHELDIMLAPEAKRRHIDSTLLDKNSPKKMPSYISETPQGINSENLKFAKSRTATNILNILDKKKSEEHVKTEIDIQSILSPYAMPSSRRTCSKHGITPNIITQKKKQKSIAEKIGETVHFNTISKSIDKTNYQAPEIPYKRYKPIISSNLQNVIPLETGEIFSRNNDTEINYFKESKNILSSNKIFIPKDLTSNEVTSMKKDPIVSKTFEDNQEISNSFSTTGVSSGPEINDQTSIIYPVNKHNNSGVTTLSSFLSQNKAIFDFSLKKDEIKDTSININSLNKNNNSTKEILQITKSLKLKIFKIDPNLLPWYSFTVLQSKGFKNNLESILLIPKTQLRKYIFTSSK